MAPPINGENRPGEVMIEMEVSPSGIDRAQRREEYIGPVLDQSMSDKRKEVELEK